MSEQSAVLKVVVTMPDMVDYDITEHVLPMKRGGLGPLRRRLNPISRTIDLSLSTILCDNQLSHFSPSHLGATWGANQYHGAKVAVSMGWMDHEFTYAEPQPLFTGFIDDIQWSPKTGLAEIKLYDALDKMKQLDVPEDLEEELQANDSPAHLALKLLGPGYAGISLDYIDSESFEDAHTIEAAASITMKKFEILAGSWSRNLTEILNHGGAGLRITAEGKIQYFTWEPDTSTGPVTLDGYVDIISFKGSEKFSGIRNSLKVSRGDHVTGSGIPTENAAVVCAGSPRTNPPSVAGFGTRFAPALTLLYFDADAPAELVADRTIELQAQPFGYYECEVHMCQKITALGLDSRVEVEQDALWTAPKSFDVIDILLQPSTGRAVLGLWDNTISDEDWLYINRAGHKVDDGKMVY